MAAVWQRGGADAAVSGGIFDLRDAPPVFGPRTEQAFRTMLERLGGKRIALVSGESAMQRLQLQRIAHGHRHAAVVDSLESARLHVTAARVEVAAPPSTSSRR
jgi:hypothetical protein